MKKSKLKKFIISIEEIDPYDEFVIEAKNKSEAKNKARLKMLSDYYDGWMITDIEEVDKDGRVKE